jgi:hypothetical protein
MTFAPTYFTSKGGKNLGVKNCAQLPLNKKLTLGELLGRSKDWFTGLPCTVQKALAFMITKGGFYIAIYALRLKFALCAYPF